MSMFSAVSTCLPPNRQTKHNIARAERVDSLVNLNTQWVPVRRYASTFPDWDLTVKRLIDAPRWFTLVHWQRIQVASLRGGPRGKNAPPVHPPFLSSLCNMCSIPGFAPRFVVRSFDEKLISGWAQSNLKERWRSGLCIRRHNRDPCESPCPGSHLYSQIPKRNLYSKMKNTRSQSAHGDLGAFGAKLPIQSSSKVC